MGDSEFLSKAEHQEFAKRIDDENHRQNERIKSLEANIRQILSLTASVEKLASNMENMLKEQEKQGKRLEMLEGKDGEMWRKMVSYVFTAIVGIVIGFIFKRIGM